MIFSRCRLWHSPFRSMLSSSLSDLMKRLPQRGWFSHQEALLYMFKDNEAVIKMIIKGRSPSMRHVSRTLRVALDWLFDRINLDPKIQIKYIDTKNQHADILAKGNFTRDEWNHLLCLFNISHFSSTVCSETMAKRSQHDSGEERVTAKSRPMMSLSARVPSNVSSSTSVSPGKRSCGNQNPWSAKAERGENRATCCRQRPKDRIWLLSWTSFSARYSKWDDNQAWSSQEWKTDTSMCERSGQPVVTSRGKTRESQSSSFHEETQHDGTAQSIVNEVILRDRPGQPVVDPSKRSKATAIFHWKRWNRIGIDSGIKIIRKQGEWSSAEKTKTILNECYRRRRKTFYYMENVHVCNNGISSIHGKGLPEQLSFNRECKRSHIKTNVRHIYKIGVWTRWDIWIGDTWLGKSFIKILVFDWWRKNHQSLTHKGFRLFGFCIVSWWDTREHPIERCMGRKIGMVQIISGIQKLWQSRRWADGLRVESFPRFNTLRQMFAVEFRWDTREFLRKNFVHDNVQSYFLWIKRQWKRMLVKCQSRYSVCKEIWKRTMDIHWSWFREKVVLDQWRQSTRRMGPYGGKDVSGISRKAVAQFSVLQVHCLEVDSKAKVMENCRYTMQPTKKQLKQFFA